MTDYELLYIVPTSLTEEEAGTVEQAVGGMLAKVSATVQSTKRLGKFQFAYPLKGQHHGYYVLVRFQAEPASVGALNELLRLSTEKVLRHLILRADEAGDEKFDLVQFQAVNVEDRGGDRRRTGASPRTGVRTEKSPEEVKAQKEGVAALEGAKESTDEAVKPLSAEDLEKKIDAALEEKA